VGAVCEEEKSRGVRVWERGGQPSTADQAPQDPEAPAMGSGRVGAQSQPQWQRGQAQGPRGQTEWAGQG
jgi:hypothetical protein